MGFSYIEFSPYIYIRSSPYGPNRDPNRTLSNELLFLFLFLYLYSISLLISISHLLISNLFLLSSISRNIGRSFLKYLRGSKIRN